MALKTFNLDEQVYREFSEHCKKNGISMSKRVENFIRGELGRIKNKGFVKEFKETKDKDLAKTELPHFSKYC